MKRHIFSDYNAAIDYAVSIGMTESYCRQKLSDNASLVCHLGRTIGFDIDGYCEVVPLIYVTEYDTEKEIRLRGHLLHLLGTDNFYYISNRDKGKYGLIPLRFIDTAYATFEYFRTSLEAPQNIGKATKNKILNWVDYADKLESEKLNYLTSKRERREKALATIKANCPQAKIRETSKGFNAYDFDCYEIHVDTGNGLTIIWELPASGGVYRRYEVCYTDAIKVANEIDGTNEKY